ncbi:MAG: MBL fold metallo-hydrolase [bacterium]
MEIKTLPVGNLEANCYIVGCSQTKEGVVIDPGANGQWIVQTIESLGWKIKYIINTHGHVDHIGANNEVKKATGAELLIKEDDVCMLTDTVKNLSAFTGADVVSVLPDRLLSEGDIISFGQQTLEVVATPGHTPGGICLKGEDCVFTGDTLFAGSVGRSDFPGGNGGLLIEMIKEKLLILPDETVVYSGHGPSSTIGREKVSNPYL